MSYSLYDTCYNCKNREFCTDRAKVQSAIDDIHTECLSEESGHMGSGYILIQCHNHTQP